MATSGVRGVDRSYGDVGRAVGRSYGDGGDVMCRSYGDGVVLLFALMAMPTVCGAARCGSLLWRRQSSVTRAA